MGNANWHASCILAGIYLAKYGKKSKLADAIRFINDILLSAPSIIIGLFVYMLMVVKIGHFSGWAGIVALALIQLPIIVRTTENMLLLIPNTLREAAYALGTPRWKVILKITLKASYSRIITGILLAVARIAGKRRHYYLQRYQINFGAHICLIQLQIYR